MTERSPASDQKLERLIQLNRKLVDQNARLLAVASAHGPTSGGTVLRVLLCMGGGLALVLSLAIYLLGINHDDVISTMQATQVISESILFAVIGVGLLVAGKR